MTDEPKVLHEWVEGDLGLRLTPGEDMAPFYLWFNRGRGRGWEPADPVQALPELAHLVERLETLRADLVASMEREETAVADLQTGVEEREERIRGLEAAEQAALDVATALQVDLRETTAERDRLREALETRGDVRPFGENA